MGRKEKDQPGWIQRQVIRMIINKTIKKINRMNGSWKTSAVAWLTLIGVFIGSLILPVLDNDPATVIDWNAVFEALKNAGIVLPVWLIGILARDKGVSTEAQRRAGTKVK